MNAEMLSFLSSYGLPGVIIFALFFGLYQMMRMFKEQSDSWLETFIESNKISDHRHVETSQMMDSRQSETNEVIRNLTAVIERNNK